MTAHHEHCDTGHGCITCGDQAHEMRVLSVDAVRGLAMCAGDGGDVVEVDTLLVDPAVVGERLLVHARVAIARIDAGTAA